jgi:cobalt-zinc-cadmium efflux system outer membrane protein
MNNMDHNHFFGELHMAVLGSRVRVLLCLVIIIVSATRMQAQGAAQDIPSALTLENAIRLAIDRNPTLAAAKSGIQAAEGDKISASKRLNPAFSVQFEDYPIRVHPGPFFDVQEITSRVDYEIERGGRRQLRTEAASRALEAQKLAYQDQTRLMRLQVEQAFYQTILAKSNLEAATLILDQVERTILLNRVRYKEGDISALELNRIEVEKLKFQDDVFQADLALRNAKSSLLALLNAPDLSEDIEVTGTLQVDYQNLEPSLPPRAPLGELIQMALKQRPDIAARVEEQRRADTETRLQRAIRSPNITVGGGYKRNLTDNTVVFDVTVPLKIFNRNEGEIMRADAEKTRAEYLVAAVQKDVQLDVQKAHNAVEVNRQRVEYIRTQQLKRAEEASQVTLQSYNLGGATLIDYLDAQRTYRDALRIYNQALFDERISLYELSSSIALGDQ